LRIKCEFEEMKGEMGPNHYEGRNWLGFHHHGVLCMAACAFLVAERARLSPQNLLLSSSPLGYPEVSVRGGGAGASDRHVDSSIATLRIYQARDLAHKPALLPVVRGEVRSSHFMTR
jgi:hypothetical protein